MRPFSTQDGEDPPPSEDKLDKILVPVGDDAFKGHPGLANVHVPDYFPTVPCIVVNKNPVLPKFVKMVEVSFDVLFFCFSAV